MLELPSNPQSSSELFSVVPNESGAFLSNIQRIRLAEDLAHFSQASPPHEPVFKDLRERSDETDDDAYDDSKEDGNGDDNLEYEVDD
ncbi:hypothetical protein L2E82_42456 [Cichorium intybus]|uniref:Uncharacterized protein n=1 Tax=Cichorium intybus TaxID=13427 RepID=A0ACB8ZN09_CICIN|nr:hypothetical protein L2E82_42456 [Cichorium intybus]